MKTPYLTPFLDRRYWDGIALGDEVDPSLEQDPDYCARTHRLAEKALTNQFRTSRYPLAIHQYRLNDTIQASEFNPQSVFHVVEEMVFADEAIPEIISDVLPPQPSLHPGGEYIFHPSMDTLPSKSSDGSVVIYDRGPGYTHITETIQDDEGVEVDIGYVQRHKLAVVGTEGSERTLLTYNADSLLRVSDGEVLTANTMQHITRPEIIIGEIKIGEVADGRALWLYRVTGAELLSEGTPERRKGRAAFRLGFLKPASHSV